MTRAATEHGDQYPGDGDVCAARRAVYNGSNTTPSEIPGEANEDICRFEKK